ncbi:hypothetical protein AVEN_130120-1 [Araneus ventricosus]|uniref:Uncharacterized protein n=1 Tax=Araneus ventricosus TaxID=182803 RepID=A0A4Y2NMZ6_ARAVE|nr:hypothetical protein AVEN_130120-1 [Araneus ventricosus]
MGLNSLCDAQRKVASFFQDTFGLVSQISGGSAFSLRQGTHAGDESRGLQFTLQTAPDMECNSFPGHIWTRKSKSQVVVSLRHLPIRR